VLDSEGRQAGFTIREATTHSQSIARDSNAPTGAGRSTRQEADAHQALARARDYLLSLQTPGGWWKAELQTNVTMDAEDLLLREFLGIRDPELTERSAKWIRSQQREDGSWSNFRGGPGDLSTTIEAYVGLRLADDPPEAEHMQAASAFVRENGGLEDARVFTHIWLAMFGAWDWDQVPTLPPEQMLLPEWFPLNVYDFACWARQTIVALSVVLAYRPRRPLSFDLSELYAGTGYSPPKATSLTGRALLTLDRVLRAYQHHPIGPIRERALARAERWIVERQEADGSWGGIQPPWVYSLIALHLRGYGLEHPIMAKGLSGLDTFTIDGGMRRLEACQSPVWDTCLSLIALADAGVPGDDEAVIRAADWLLEEQILAPGDWAIRRPNLQPGGWAFEFANANYPDVDDTAEVVLALRTVDHPDPPRVKRAIDRGLRWLEGMQSSDGGWGAFDSDNCRRLVRDLPFCDFGEVIDPPSADVTAHAVEMLAELGRSSETSTRRGVQWLLAAQEPDGSWFGRWGVNYIYGTGAAVPALVAAGLDRGAQPIRRAVRWLQEHQNPDGGWGEDCRSYDDPAWIGRGTSTASQTAWALLALNAAGERSEAVSRGIEWLVETQRADGGWDEPEFTGTGFPSDFYINYHLYRVVFPIMALGRCSRRVTNASDVLILSPLAIEARAAGRAVAWARVQRIGMGPRRATRSAEQLTGARAILIAGFCGALDSRLEPGDVVLASELRDAHGTIACDDPSTLAAALDHGGMRVHVGPIACTERLLIGRRRAELSRSSGAIAVDMESSSVARATPIRPLLVMRVVSDGPGHELYRPLGMIAGGLTAYRALKRACELTEQWARSARLEDSEPQLCQSH
jgi:squalene-hopene/tetraprenyl-beta-curcumene cyclase